MRCFWRCRSRTLRQKSKSNARVPGDPARADEAVAGLERRRKRQHREQQARGHVRPAGVERRDSRRRGSRARSAARNSCRRRRARSCGTSAAATSAGQAARSTRSPARAADSSDGLPTSSARREREREQVQPDVADPGDHHVREALRAEQLIGRAAREDRASRPEGRRDQEADRRLQRHAELREKIDELLRVRPAARRRGARFAQSRERRRRSRRARSRLRSGVPRPVSAATAGRCAARSRACRRAIATMNGGALSLLANASAKRRTIQHTALTEPSRAKRSRVEAREQQHPAMKRSGLGDSAAFAIAGNGDAQARSSSSRVRKPSANCFSSVHAGQREQRQHHDRDALDHAGIVRAR